MYRNQATEMTNTNKFSRSKFFTTDLMNFFCTKKIIVSNVWKHILRILIDIKQCKGANNANRVNQWTGFYVMTTLAFNELTLSRICFYLFIWPSGSILNINLKFKITIRRAFVFKFHCFWINSNNNFITFLTKKPCFTMVDLSSSKI